MIEERFEKEERKDDCVRYDISERHEEKEWKEWKEMKQWNNFLHETKKQNGPTIPAIKENRLKLKEKRKIV